MERLARSRRGQSPNPDRAITSKRSRTPEKAGHDSGKDKDTGTDKDSGSGDGSWEGPSDAEESEEEVPPSPDMRKIFNSVARLTTFDPRRRCFRHQRAYEST